MTIVATADTPSEAPPDRPTSRLRILPLAAAALVIVAIVVVLVVVANPHHHKATLLNLPAPASGEALSGGAAQMLALLNAGGRQTFAASYGVTGVGAKTGGLVSLQIWQRPGDRREDTVIDAAGRTERTASFTHATTVETCEQINGAAWTCQPTSIDPNNILASVAGTASGKSVSVSNTTIGGRAVTCFQVGMASEGSKLCATSQGIPVLISTPSTSFQLAMLTQTIPAGIFDIP